MTGGEAMEKKLMLGNEAVARGAYEDSIEKSCKKTDGCTLNGKTSARLY